MYVLHKFNIFVKMIAEIRIRGHNMMDFKKHNRYLINPFCAVHLRLSWEECDICTKYAASNTDVIHGGRFAVCDPSKS